MSQTEDKPNRTEQSLNRDHIERDREKVEEKVESHDCSWTLCPNRDLLQKVHWEMYDWLTDSSHVYQELVPSICGLTGIEDYLTLYRVPHHLVNTVKLDCSYRFRLQCELTLQTQLLQPIQSNRVHKVMTHPVLSFEKFIICNVDLGRSPKGRGRLGLTCYSIIKSECWP